MDRFAVDTHQFTQVHGRPPRRDAYGRWAFTTSEGVRVELTGEFRQVKQALVRELGAGEYALLP